MSFLEPTASRGIFPMALKSLPRFSMSNSRSPLPCHGELHSGAQQEREERRDGDRKPRACAVQPLPSGVPEAWLGSQDTPRPCPDTPGLMLV